MENKIYINGVELEGTKFGNIKLNEPAIKKTMQYTYKNGLQFQLYL